MTEKDLLGNVQEQEERIEAKDGTQVFMRSWFPQGGIEHVVLAVHGNASHSGLYRKMALTLCERKMATFAIDMRGFGRTGTQGDVQDFNLIFEDIAMALDAVRARHPGLPLSLLSWSLGGVMVLNTFGQHELDLSTLIFLAPAVKTTVSVSGMLRVLAFFAKSAFARDARFDATAMMPKQLLKTEFGRLVLEDELATKRFSKRFIQGLGTITQVARLMHGAARINVPTLIIHGKGDTMANPDGSHQLHENLTVSQKKLVEIPDMLHDLDGLSAYQGPGLRKPLTPNASRVMEEIVAWLRANHA